MTNDEYLQNRLEDQINWYDNKSMQCQQRFKLIRGFEIVFAALIPVLSVIPDDTPILKVAIAALGGAIVVFSGISNMNKYQELWMSYRTTAETLKHHKYLYETQSNPYDKKTAFSDLVENVENLVSRENSNWNSMIKEQKEQEDKT